MSTKKLGFMLTTVNNPHNPFDDWSRWYKRDLDLGYDTCGLLARMSFRAEDIDDDETAMAVMADIIRNNFSGVHVMVTRDQYNPELNPLEF